MTQRIDGLRLLFQPLGQVCKLLDLAAIHGLKQGFASRKMPVKGADADAGLPGDGLEACLGATGTENRFSSLKHPLAVPNGIDARLSCRFRLCRLPHAIVQFRPLEKRRNPPYMATSHADT